MSLGNILNKFNINADSENNVEKTITVVINEHEIIVNNEKINSLDEMIEYIDNIALDNKVLLDSKMAKYSTYLKVKEKLKNNGYVVIEEN